MYAATHGALEQWSAASAEFPIVRGKSGITSIIRGKAAGRRKQLQGKSGPCMDMNRVNTVRVVYLGEEEVKVHQESRGGEKNAKCRRKKLPILSGGSIDNKLLCSIDDGHKLDMG